MAITPAFLASLPTIGATEHHQYVWHPAQGPIVWCGPLASGETPRAVAVGEPLVLDLSTARLRRTAEWRLLRASGKPQDGWLSRRVHRPISRVFSWGFLRFGLSANVATAMAFLIGLAAALLMAQTSHATMVGGGLLFWFASIADGIDGEVARLSLTESRFGEQLDTAVDQLTHLAGLAGVLTGWWRQGIGPVGIGLAVAVLVGTPAVLLWAMALVRRARQTRQWFVPTKPIETALFRARDATGAWPLRAAAAVFVLFRREAFSCSFFALSLVTERRAIIPAAIAAGLAIVVITFLSYGSTLGRMLRETVGPPPADTTTRQSTTRSAAPA